MYSQKGIVPCIVSDHSIIYAARKASKSNRDVQYVEAKYFRRFNELSFLNDLHAISWEVITCTNSPDLALDLFLGLLHPICEKHAPTTKIKINKSHPGWITDDYFPGLLTAS